MTWNRITSDPRSLPDEGRLVLLAWEKDPMHAGKPHVEREVYKVEWELDGQSYLWAHHSDSEQDLLIDDQFPSHWQYFPDPPEAVL